MDTASINQEGQLETAAMHKNMCVCRCSAGHLHSKLAQPNMHLLLSYAGRCLQSRAYSSSSHSSSPSIWHIDIINGIP